MEALELSSCTRPIVESPADFGVHRDDARHASDELLEKSGIGCRLHLTAQTNGTAIHVDFDSLGHLEPERPQE